MYISHGLNSSTTISMATMSGENATQALATMTSFNNDNTTIEHDNSVNFQADDITIDTILHHSSRAVSIAPNDPIVTTASDITTTFQYSMTSSYDLLNTTSFPDYEVYLREFNGRFAQLMLPAISYLGVLMVAGVIGNCFVLYIYLRKLKHNTTRSFVLALALFDLVSCVVAIPGEVIDLLHNYTFGSYIMCKLLRTVNSFSAFASGLTLFVVAVDRYKRICTPLAKQQPISIKTANIILLCCCVVSMFLSAPASIIYGSRTATTDVPWINGSDCSTADVYLGTVFPIIYNGVQFLFFVVGAIGLMILYSLIGRRIWRHRKFRVEGQSSTFIIRYSDSGSDTSPQPDDAHKQVGFISPSGPVPTNDTRDKLRTVQNGKKKMSAIKILHRTSLSTSSPTTSPDTSPDAPTWTLPKPEVNRKVSRDHQAVMRKVSMRRSTLDRRHSILPSLVRRETNARRTTLMLFLITLIFILSFLPHLVLMTVKALDKRSLSGSGDLIEIFLNIGIRSYFINSVANPIVYSFCCQKFRTEIMKILKCSSCRK